MTENTLRMDPGPELRKAREKTSAGDTRVRGENAVRDNKTIPLKNDEEYASLTTDEMKRMNDDDLERAVDYLDSSVISMNIQLNDAQFVKIKGYSWHRKTVATRTHFTIALGKCKRIRDRRMKERQSHILTRNRHYFVKAAEKILDNDLYQEIWCEALGMIGRNEAGSINRKT